MSQNGSHSLIIWQFHLEKHSIRGNKANAPGPSFIHLPQFLFSHIELFIFPDWRITIYWIL